jgi:hypothetical protein
VQSALSVGCVLRGESAHTGSLDHHVDHPGKNNSDNDNTDGDGVEVAPRLTSEHSINDHDHSEVGEEEGI